MKTKTVSQRVEDDTTPRSPVGLISYGISPDVIPYGIHVADLDAEHFVDLIIVRRTKLNLQK